MDKQIATRHCGKQNKLPFVRREAFWWKQRELRTCGKAISQASETNVLGIWSENRLKFKKQMPTFHNMHEVSGKD